jgi:hypothetical protein
MSQRRMPGSSFLANLRAGDYGPVERVMKVLGNVGRKATRRQACCGNYGDPGC